MHYVPHILGWNDIGYSFLIGEDGRAYEGRGWGTQGAHTLGYNTNAHGISVIGTFTSKNPNQLALNAINALIDCGMAAVSISKDNLTHLSTCRPTSMGQ